jgi:uncharacterized protein YkwD
MRTLLVFGCWLVLAVSAFLPGSLPAQSPKQAKFEMTAEEKQIVDLTNEVRKKASLQLLRPNPLLFQAARAHSANMAKQHKMDHVLDGKKLRDRLRAVQYRFRFCGENLAWGDFPIREVFKGWMDSEKHRMNILDKEFTEIGLGRVLDDKGDFYYTQVFAKPMAR